MKHACNGHSALAVRHALSSILLLLAGLTTLPGHAQTFWQTTASAPFGPKKGLLAIGDSTLLTAVSMGLLRSTNQGRSWKLVRRTRPVYTLYATRQGLLLAGGTGVVYRSHDAGTTWDSVAVATVYPITTFTATTQGDLLLGTGGYDARGNDVGDGVFFSDDAGRTWTPRNAGFGTARSVTHLLADQQGRLFAATTEYDDPSKQPGLYWSANSGQLWHHLPLHLNDPQWPRPVTVYYVTSLVITPQDSLICSFTGAMHPILAQGNFIKSVADATNPAIGWTSLMSSGRWWDHDPVLPVHIARDGSWYSSRIGLRSGGTLRSTNQGRSWSLLKGGLGSTNTGLYQQQFFAEFPSGKLFMVQLGDGQVYYHQATALAAKAPQKAPAVELFPNPTTGPLQVVSIPGQRVASITLYDLQGRHLRTVRPTAEPARIDLTAEVPGMYQVTVELAGGRFVRQKVLRQ